MKQLTTMLLMVSCSSAFCADDVARVRTELAAESPVWVGQKVSFHIDLMSSTLFSGAPRFDLPELAGAFVMKVAGRPVLSTEQVDGQSWSVQRHDFSVYPHQRGSFTIPAFSVRFAVAPAFGKPPEEQSLESTAFSFEAQMPPGAEGLALLISTPDLHVEEVWTPPIPADGKLELEVGDAITRQVSVRAQDVPGMALPEIPTPEPAGAAVYPQQPSVTDEGNRGQLTGTRTDVVTFVCERPGTLHLPALVIPWWDTAANQLRRVKLPSITINVASAAVSVDEQGDTTVSSDQKPRATRLLLIGLLVASGVILSIGVSGRRISKTLRAAKARRDQGEPACFARLTRACQHDEPVATLNALMRWLDQQSTGTESMTIDGFCSRQSRTQLAVELDVLQRAAMDTSRPWSGDGLLRELSEARKSAHHFGRVQSTSKLPKLNPTSDESAIVNVRPTYVARTRPP